MESNKITSDVVKIMYRRYIGDDPKRKAGLEEARQELQREGEEA